MRIRAAIKLLLIGVLCFAALESVYAFTFNDVLVDAADRGDAEEVLSFLDAGHPVDSMGDFGVTALMRAAVRDNESIAKILIRAGANVDAADIGGATPLHLAARKGNIEVIKLLLRYGADIDAPDKEGWTPLMRSIMAGKDEVAKYLIASGADVAKVNGLDESVLVHAVMSGSADILTAVMGSNSFSNISKEQGELAIDTALEQNNRTFENILTLAFKNSGNSSTKSTSFEFKHPDNSSYTPKDRLVHNADVEEVARPEVAEKEDKEYEYEFERPFVADGNENFLAKVESYNGYNQARPSLKKNKEDKITTVMPAKQTQKQTMEQPKEDYKPNIANNNFAKASESTISPIVPRPFLKPRYSENSSKNIVSSDKADTQGIHSVIERNFMEPLDVHQEQLDEDHGKQEIIEGMPWRWQEQATEDAGMSVTGQHVAGEKANQTSFLLQLGALPSEDEALYLWEDLRKANPDILVPLEVDIIKAFLVDGNQIYRLRAGTYYDRSKAENSCITLRNRNVECFIVEIAPAMQNFASWSAPGSINNNIGVDADSSYYAANDGNIPVPAPYPSYPYAGGAYNSSSIPVTAPTPPSAATYKEGSYQPLLPQNGRNAVSEAKRISREDYFAAANDNVSTTGSPYGYVVSDGRAWVQIGGFVSQQQAEDYWERMFGYDRNFSGLQKMVIPAMQAGGGLMLRVGALESDFKAFELCRVVKIGGYNCAIYGSAGNGNSNIGADYENKMQQYWLDLGSFDDENEAEYYWMFLNEDNPDLVASLKYSLVNDNGEVVNGNSGIPVNLHAGPFTQEYKAKQLCSVLRQRNIACIVD